MKCFCSSIFIALLGAATARAAPITYVMNFTGNTGISLTGGFTYNSDLPSAPFSAFNVRVNGLNADFTSFYNLTYASITGGGSLGNCIAPFTPGKAFDYFSGA